MRTLIIGDLHGNLTKFKKALDFIKFEDSDKLYFTGDFCDRGFENIDTLKFCMSLKNFYPVFGNHDIWLYQYLKGYMNGDAYRCWYSYNGGYNTVNELEDYSFDDYDVFKNYLENIPFMRHINDNTIITHNYINFLSLQKDPIYSNFKTYEDFEKITLKNHEELIKHPVYDEVIYSRNELNDIFYQIYYLKDKRKVTKEDTNTLYCTGHTPLKEPFYDNLNNLLCIDTGHFKEERPTHIYDLNNKKVYTYKEELNEV